MAELGFGLMRLPLTDPNDQASIDIPQLERMVDMFLEAGLDYFDTAFMYHNNASEVAIRKALVERYPRESFKLTTKLPIYNLRTPEEAEKVFNEQLEKTGAGYFDTYLIHNVNHKTMPGLTGTDAFEMLKRKKAEGKIKRMGFSYHDRSDMLDRILSEHPEVEVVQLQINYLDWDSPIESRKNLEVCRKYKVPVIVMEPVKGGLLANVPDEVKAMFEEKYPGLSAASWALRYVLGLEGVETVLSGMSSIDQMKDNLSFCLDFKPLDEEDLRIIDKAVSIIRSNVSIDCTGCRYCMKSCPKDIPIADYFHLYNDVKAEISSEWFGKMYYNNMVQDYGKASDCIGCGTCEKNCPQNLHVMDLLKDVASAFEKE